MDQILSLALPLIVGSITVPIFGKLKDLVTVIDGLPPIVQRLAVLGVASGLTWGSGQLGVMLPTDLALWTPDTTEMVLSAGIAFAFHAGGKK